MLRTSTARIVFVCVVLGACGGDGSGGATPTTVDVPSTRELQRALLVARDLPAGYVRYPDDAGEDDGSGDICRDFDPDAKVPSINEVEVGFTNESTVSIVGERVAVFSLEDARRYMTELGNVFVNCGAFSDVEPDGSTSTGSIMGIDFPTYGDETTAMKIDVQGSDYSLSLHSVVVRVDNLVVAVTGGGGTALELPLVQSLVEKAVERVQDTL